MTMTLSLINISDELERALRERAAAEQKSVDAVVVDVLACGLGVEPQKPAKKRDLSFLTKGPPLEPEVLRALEEQRHIDLTGIAGTWVSDPETEAILEEQGTLKRRDLTGIAGLRLINEEMKAVFDEQRRIDPELWK